MGAAPPPADHPPARGRDGDRGRRWSSRRPRPPRAIGPGANSRRASISVASPPATWRRPATATSSWCGSIPRRWELAYHTAADHGGQNRNVRAWAEKLGLAAAINAGHVPGRPAQPRRLPADRRPACATRTPNDYLSAAACGPRRRGDPAFRIFDLDETPLDSLRVRYRTVVQNLRLIKRPRDNRWTARDRGWAEAALGEDARGRALLIFCQIGALDARPQRGAARAAARHRLRPAPRGQPARAAARARRRHDADLACRATCRPFPTCSASSRAPERTPPMEYRHLGRSGLRVSALSYGAWVTFGDQFGEDTAYACMKAAYDAGVNFFDNAEAYAHGEAETDHGQGAAARRLEAQRPGDLHQDLLGRQGSERHRPVAQAHHGGHVRRPRTAGPRLRRPGLLPSSRPPHAARRDRARDERRRHQRHGVLLGHQRVERRSRSAAPTRSRPANTWCRRPWNSRSTTCCSGRRSRRSTAALYADFGLGTTVWSPAGERHPHRQVRRRHSGGQPLRPREGVVAAAHARGRGRTPEARRLAEARGRGRRPRLHARRSSRSPGA